MKWGKVIEKFFTAAAAGAASSLTTSAQNGQVGGRDVAISAAVGATLGVLNVIRNVAKHTPKVGEGNAV